MSNIIDLFTRKLIVAAIQGAEFKPYNEVRARIEARFGDNLPKHFKRTMAKPQAQPYMHGDVHNVVYRKKLKNFNSPMPVPCEVTQESCAKLGEHLILGMDCCAGIDEPFPWMDSKYQVTLNFLKSLPNGTKLMIFTRSDLIAHDDYVAELQRLDCTVNLLYTDKNEEKNRINEPGCPTYKRRYKANMKLNQSGIQSTMKRHSFSLKAVKNAVAV